LTIIVQISSVIVVQIGAATQQATLGRYVIVKHLAQGGMADVLLARTNGIEGFERYVVIKRIRAEIARDTRYVAMFLDEARLAASLHHHNIVGVNDIGQKDGEYFFAMEYLHGEDARRLLIEVSRKRECIPIEHVITIATAAAAGLHHAHEQRGIDRKPLGIVHRDVSPANLLLGYDGSVKVADFGIAKAEQRSTETRTGTLKGKIAYMSPEQCIGDDVDRRSDVFSLGIVLYELVTARRLFKGDTDFLTMTAIVHGDIPPPSRCRPDLSPALEAIILKALARDRGARYATADALRIALEQYANAAGIVRSSTALADYLKAQFGNRPEPWLVEEDDGEPEIEMTVDFDGSASGIAQPPAEAIALFPSAGSDAPIARAHSEAVAASPARRWRRWGLPMAAAAVIGIVLAIAAGGSRATDEHAARPPARVVPPAIEPAPVRAAEPVIEAAPPPIAEVVPAAPTTAEPTPAPAPTTRPAKKRVMPAAKRASNPKAAKRWDRHALFPE
jgi:serine/threonine-protein kinase